MHGKLLAAMAVFCAVISGASVSAGGVEDASDDVGDFVLERTDEKPVEAMKGLQSKEGTTKNETGEPVEAIKRLALKEAATTNETVKLDRSSIETFIRVPVHGLSSEVSFVHVH